MALTPHRDMFRKVCKVAVVAGRPMSYHEDDPPTIDIFWGDDEDVEIDPVECRST